MSEKEALNHAIDTLRVFANMRVPLSPAQVEEILIGVAKRRYPVRPFWIGQRGDVGHSEPVYCQQHLCWCTDAETNLHKFYSDEPPPESADREDTSATPRGREASWADRREKMAADILNAAFTTKREALWADFVPLGYYATWALEPNPSSVAELEAEIDRILVYVNQYRAKVWPQVWCCEHHPSFIENLTKNTHPCGICTEPPTWYSFGRNRKPKSWKL